MKDIFIYMGVPTALWYIYMWIRIFAKGYFYNFSLIFFVQYAYEFLSSSVAIFTGQR